MAVVALTTLEGDRKDLLSKYDQVVNAVLASPPAGLISHTCVELPNGIRIASMYESEQQARAFYSSSLFQEAIRKAGIGKVEPQFLPVHNYRIFSAKVSV